jgi:D-alanyl-lipoteichoic acid acyltransferase DltB (MBOAT superfamily)
MLFNSISFAIFLPLVFILYWFVFNKKIGHQNFLILITSYVFYGWWDYRFLCLIFISSIADYFIGLFLYKSSKANIRKLLLSLSLLINLGFLGFFKYYNFFMDSFVEAFQSLGYQMNARSLSIILPVGISFYTFQTLSYSIDIYRKKLRPTKNIVAFFAFVSFFPQLVAGPIERASQLLPQFKIRRYFSLQKSVDGLRQILWGLFKKIVIADTCATYANEIFSNYSHLNGSVLLLGVLFFSFQIYGDFSGYSDIAIGTARLFGFDLMRNFNLPYFSRNIGEFWRRWHISLSTWFRDYVYIPLGGSRARKHKQIFNILTTFTISGFWHGANWTFIAWGFLNGLYYIPSILFGNIKNEKKLTNNIVAIDRLLPNFKELLQITITFLLTLLAWVFFRAESIPHAFSYLNNLFSSSFFTLPNKSYLGGLILILGFVVIEWIQRRKQHGLEFSKLHFVGRWAIYYVLIFFIIYTFQGNSQFIYFQF